MGIILGEARRARGPVAGLSPDRELPAVEHNLPFISSGPSPHSLAVSRLGWEAGQWFRKNTGE